MILSTRLARLFPSHPLLSRTLISTNLKLASTTVLIPQELIAPEHYYDIRTFYLQKWMGLQPTVHLYNKIFHSFQIRGYLDEMVNFLVHLDEDLLYKDRDLMKNVLAALGLVGRIEPMLEIFRRVSKRQDPDQSTYDELFQAFFKTHKPQLAYQYFQEMISSGLTPSDYAERMVIQTLGQAKAFGQMLEIYEVIKKFHTRTGVSTWVIGDVFTSLTNAQRSEDLIRIYNESIQKKDDIFIHKMMLFSCVILRLNERAENIIAHIEKFKGSREWYETIIGYLGQKGDIDAMRKCALEMQEAGQPMTYNISFRLMKHAGDKNDLHLMEMYFEERKRLFGNKITLADYNVLLQCYYQNNEVRKMQVIFRNMIREGIRPNLQTFSFLMFGMGEDASLETISSLITKMTEIGVFPNLHFYNWTIHISAKKGDIPSMERYFQDLRSNFQPDYWTYSSLLRGYVSSGNVEKMVEAFSSIKELVENPKEYIINQSLIDNISKVYLQGLCSGDRLDIIIQETAYLLDKNFCTLDDELKEILLLRFAQDGNVDAIMTLMEHKKLEVNDYLIAFREFIKSGLLQHFLTMVPFLMNNQFFLEETAGLIDDDKKLEIGLSTVFESLLTISRQHDVSSKELEIALKEAQLAHLNFSLLYYVWKQRPKQVHSTVEHFLKKELHPNAFTACIATYVSRFAPTLLPTVLALPFHTKKLLQS
eukprot:TRINITY_DN14891_c0_g1_i1.p1 TRINITY_DN14891_c0_g1~~TRINITY_DN14891_c0_g1_i1.p1  ORF type:complete len:704 (+),score=123.89 TRINITY_DN14891_c0_g1_i1:37-2148(+)